MVKTYDVVIIGGAIIGASVAYFLSVNPDFDGKILVVEKDVSFSKSSTALSFSSIRTQFSNPINVKISQFGVEFIRNFSELMSVSGENATVTFHEFGYLFLANTKTQAQALKANHNVQKACGADVVLWTKDELAVNFPHLNVDDICLASYGQSGEGWFDNMSMLSGFRRKAKALGVEFISDEVVGMRCRGGKVDKIALKSGEMIEAHEVVNASGARAALTAQMAGLKIPVEPRKRTIFVFDCADSPEGSARVKGGHLPLMIDPSGVFCRPEGNVFLAGTPPAYDPAVDLDDFTPRYQEFDEIIWPALAARSSAFESIKLLNQWAGHYAYNTLDHNLIIGRHPDLQNFIFANGFSGHGLQQAPATGRAVAELIAYNEYRTLDCSDVGYERVMTNRPFFERTVI